MSAPPTVICDNTTLFRSYQKLQRNDIILGTVRLKPGEEHLLTDLIERGVRFIPSATAQLASRSKVFQAAILHEFLLPGTMPIYDQHALLDACTLYQKQLFTKVIYKHDRKNAGLGIQLFRSIEDVYNQACGGALSFPFVIQPFIEYYSDVRVVILDDDYHEAYQRTNPHNFRNNLHCGGTTLPYTLSENQLFFCKKIMRRAGFTWAHLDLMITPSGTCWLTEINLHGGLRGAQISKQEYRERIENNSSKRLNRLLKEN